MKSGSVPDWSEPSIYDPKEDVLTIAGLNLVFGCLMHDKFIIPNGTLFNKAILMLVGKNWRNYRHDLKLAKFNPNKRTKGQKDKRTKEQIMNDVPPEHTKDNWIHLVELVFGEESEIVKDW
ncbi:hypothetical protein V2J09_008266 [Rumex salicifolius]